jgi:hypothetical protein
LRCQLRSLDCGPKLPPQGRPRSVTSVPTDRRRPVSLNIDTHVFANRDDDTPISAGSFHSALNSLPVSPFLFPVQPNFDGLGTSIDGSPVAFHLDAFEPSSGYSSFIQTDIELISILLLRKHNSFKIHIN